jgi:hypothetical protein
MATGSPNKAVFKARNYDSCSSDSDADELDDNNSQADDYSIMTDVLDNFGPFANRMKESEDAIEEGEVFLKTKKGLNRRYFIKMVGIDLFFYKEGEEEEHEFMHCLRGIYVKMRD